jgi:hypothetical protein
MFSFFFTGFSKSMAGVSPLKGLYGEPTLIVAQPLSVCYKASVPVPPLKEAKSAVLEHFGKFFNRLNKRNLFSKSKTRSFLLFYYKKKISVFKRLTKWALSLILGNLSTKMSKIGSISKLSGFLKNFKNRRFKKRSLGTNTNISFFSQLRLLKRKNARFLKLSKQPCGTAGGGAGALVGFRTFLFKLSKKGSNRYSNTPTFFKRFNKVQTKKRPKKIFKFSKFTRLFGTPKL